MTGIAFPGLAQVGVARAGIALSGEAGIGLGFVRGRGVTSALSRWLAGGNLSGKTLRHEGDSTTSNFTTLFSEYTAFTTKPGELLAGATVTNAGNNGATLAMYLSDGVANGISATIAAAPGLDAIRYGINDLRMGGSPGDTVDSLQNKLRNNLVTAINILRAALPSTDFALVIPNSLLSTDPTASGYVTLTNAFAGMTLAQAAQAITDIMWNAYMSLRNRWPNVIVIDLQTGIYGRTCQPTSVYMADILHPVNTPVHAQLVSNFLAGYWGYRAPFDPVLSAAAWASNPSNPWTVYSRAIEDPNHCTLIVGEAFGINDLKSGRYSNGTLNGGFIDFVCDVAANVHTLDYVEQAWGAGAGATWQIPGGAVVNQQTGLVTRIFNLGGALPSYSQSGGTYNIWRKFA